jgi:hypothetical protein
MKEADFRLISALGNIGYDPKFRNRKGEEGMYGKQQCFNWAERKPRVKINAGQLKRCPQVCGLRRAIYRPVPAVLGITFALITLTISQAADAQVISQAARAQLIEVTARPAGDIVNWGQLNVSPGTTISTPQPFTSYGGIDGSATVDQNGNATIQEQCCRGLEGLWDGNFAPGDLLFDTSNTAVRLTLSFKKPVKSVGTQIGANTFGSFIAQIQAFDHSKLLGTFRENGYETSLAYNSAIFLGVMATTANITSVIYTVTNGTGSPEGFAINQVTISQ